ncbi:hypothetical protein ASE93_14400 [Serratia sp. Leaf50]|uniref:hypothetical protein n=1 Tax=Rouxiella sp. S1S-2 TaxID=2653856 RepID=UPI0006FDD365|nr:hypothetical protein [Rouxiella sp. S1S-2]KAB7897027.1 hypothetical protein GA565_14090 [Rouxiella sp. S1S-2]KQN46457.1 hypothetical protein ASE93_14400 [Serratia sp. Leaf50]
MTTINQVNAAPVISSPSSAMDAVNGQGVIGTLNEVMMMLQKMNGEIRDIQRDFVSASFKNAFDKEIASLDLKSEAIETNYKAAVMNAGVKIATGAVSLVGATAIGVSPNVAGGKFMEATKAVSDGMNAYGKIAEGSIGVASAGISRDAQKIELKADYQQTHANQIRQTISAAADKAVEASRRMLEMTGELTRLQAAILDKVRM